MCSGRSLLNKRNKSGPKTDPLVFLKESQIMCKVLHIISANYDNSSNKYYLDSTELVPTKSEKDLGFTTENTLNV